MLETNIDDMNPETYEFVMDALFAAGALDVFLAPIQMKKNRPATLLRVLSKPDDVATLTAILFTETTTLGVREQTVDRHALSRIIDHVDTPYGPVHVRLLSRRRTGQERAGVSGLPSVGPAHGVPLREVYQAAQEAPAQDSGDRLICRLCPGRRTSSGLQTRPASSAVNQPVPGKRRAIWGANSGHIGMTSAGRPSATIVPPSSTTMRSAAAAASSTSWVTSRTA